jgi:hypothetical protein
VNKNNEGPLEDHDFDLDENDCNENDNAVGSSASRNSSIVLICDKRT